jgi:hypothetical protein
MICFERVQERLELPKVTTGNGDVLRESDCGHAICRACMAKYVTVQVEEQRVYNLHCPAVGCRTGLFENDLRSLARQGTLEDKVVDRFVEFRARDFTARAKGFTESATLQDRELLRVLWESTRLCPRCKVAIEKSLGCNSFYCVCGHHFHYDKAPRAVGNGIRKFQHIMDTAETLHMSLKEALDEVEKVGGGRIYHKACRLRKASGMSLEHAVDVCKRAQQGDAEARAVIQRSRRLEAPGGDERATSVA